VSTYNRQVWKGDCRWQSSFFDVENTAGRRKASMKFLYKTACISHASYVCGFAEMNKTKAGGKNG